MRSRSFRQQGFTLLEVLVSMAIFSIGALGVLAMVATTMHLNMNSKNITEANQLGIRQLEKMQVVPFGDASFANACTSSRCYLTAALAPTATVTAIRPSDVLGGTAGSNGYYEVTWNVEVASGLRYIHVQIYWPKDRNLIGADWSGTLDCQTTPGSCYSLEYHSYRR